MKELSYALGVSIAHNLKTSGFDVVDGDKFAKAVTDVFGDKELEISVQDASNKIQTYLKEVEAKKFAANKEDGEEFLNENATRKSVTVLESGLQYEILTEGSGDKPKATDKVKCHYHGTLINGTVFDSSVERGEPAVFPVNGVIQGWVEALQLMAVGSKWRLFIPYNLAYGERGAGQQIGPYTTLVFEVELLGIE